MSFPAEVRAEMGRQQLSNRALAEKSGIHEAQISRKVVREERDLSLGEAIALGQAVCVPAWELLRRADLAKQGVVA